MGRFTREQLSNRSDAQLLELWNFGDGDRQAALALYRRHFLSSRALAKAELPGRHEERQAERENLRIELWFRTIVDLQGQRPNDLEQHMSKIAKELGDARRNELTSLSFNFHQLKSQTDSVQPDRARQLNHSWYRLEPSEKEV